LTGDAVIFEFISLTICDGGVSGEFDTSLGLKVNIVVFFTFLAFFTIETLKTFIQLFFCADVPHFVVVVGVITNYTGFVFTKETS
jgi:hypothetical protein